MGWEDWRCDLSLVSVKDGGRFLMHVRVVVVAAADCAAASDGVVMIPFKLC